MDRVRWPHHPGEDRDGPRRQELRRPRGRLRAQPRPGGPVQRRVCEATLKRVSSFFYAPPPTLSHTHGNAEATDTRRITFHLIPVLCRAGLLVRATPRARRARCSPRAAETGPGTVGEARPREAAPPITCTPRGAGRPKS